MVYQAEITQPSNEPETVMLHQHMSGVAACVSHMIDLQLELLAVDLKSIRKGILYALGTGAVALCLLAGALPTLFIGTGFLLSNLTGMSPGAGLLCVSLGVMTFVGLLLTVAYRVFRKQLDGFDRSQAELRRNLTALKSVKDSLLHQSDPISVQ
jgi:hypothetical protein